MNSARISLAAIAAISAFGLAACGGSSSAENSEVAKDCTPAHKDVKTKVPGTLTVAVYVSAPYTSLERDSLGGIDGTIIKRLAKEECLKIAASPVDGAAFVTQVQSGRADAAIGGIAHTDDRAKILSLSDTMYHEGMSVLSADGLKSLEDLKGKKVGVIQGYLWNEQLVDALGKDNVKIYQDSVSLNNDLTSGRADAGIYTSAEAAFRAKGDLKAAVFEPNNTIPASHETFDIVILSPKGSTSLTAAFNEDIAAITKSGELAQILEDNGIDSTIALKK